MWITLTLKYWKPIAVAILVMALYGYGYLQGMKSVEAEWDKARTRQLENNLKINAEVSGEHAKKMADLRKRYDALRLRTAGGVRLPKSPCGSDGKAIANEFSIGMGDNVTALMYEADRNTQQLLSLQEWIRSVSK